MARSFGVISLVLLGISCQSPATNQLAAGPSSEPSFERRSEQITAQLRKQLQQELFTAVQEGGPAAAIEICHRRAPQIAAELSRGGLTVKRIGTRVRNKQTNTPSPAEATVLSKLTRAQPTYVGELDGARAYVKAIFIPGEVCLKCHGGPGQIAPEVAQQLRTLYPDDEAVGFALGDLRGAFVVRETPPP